LTCIIFFFTYPGERSTFCFCREIGVRFGPRDLSPIQGET
jgi:hypothetical protein